MPVMHPILTNFSKGELSPKLAARTDLTIANQGALEMTNVLAMPTGGAIKRPGTKAVMNILSNITEDVNIIPWSVDAVHDFLIVLTPGHIKLINVSHGVETEYVKNDSGVVIDITVLGNIGSSSFDAYTDVHNISYAQTLNKIFIAHKSGTYPLFYIEYRSDNGNGSFNIAYGLTTIVGNVAKTEKVEESSAIKIITTDQIINLLSGYLDAGDSTKTWTAADGLSGEVKVGNDVKSITSITITKDVSERKAHSGFEGYYYDSSDPAPVNSNYKYLGSGINTYTTWFFIFGTVHKDLTGFIGEYASIAETKTQRLNRLEKMGLLDGQTYYVANRKTDLDVRVPLQFWRTRVKYTVTIQYSGGSITKTSEEPYSELSGWFEISSINVKVNGYSSYVSDLIDKTTTWMVPDVSYPCIQDSTLEGKTPAWAVRKDTSDGPTLVVTYTDGTNRTFTRKDSRVTGQIKVNVTPFAANGYPTTVCFWQGRMVLAYRNILYVSKVNDITNFSFYDDIQYTHTEMAPSSEWQDPNVPEYVSITSVSQQITAASGMFFLIATDENEYIQNVVSEDDLYIFTMSSEFAIPGGVTAVNARVKMLSRIGSSYVQPRFVAKAPLFVNQSRTKMYFAGETPTDITKYAGHLFKNDKIVKVDYISDPESIVLVTTESGLLYYGTISEEGISFIRIQTAGTIMGTIGIRGYDKDDVYLVCKRPQLGTTTLELFSDIDTSSFKSRIYLDFDLFVENYSLDTLPLLADKEISYIIKRGEKFITGTAVVGPSGELNFLQPGDDAHVGFGYASRIKTFRIDSVSTDMYLKRAGKIFFTCDDTGPFNLVNDPYGLYHPKEEYPIYLPEIDGIVSYPYTGIIPYENPSAWDIEQYVILESPEPHPFCVLSVVAEFDVSEV